MIVMFLILNPKKKYNKIFKKDHIFPANILCLQNIQFIQFFI